VLVFFVVDLFAGAAACGLCTAIWLLTGGGTTTQLSRIANDPTLATKYGFWPVWVYVSWGAVLVVHLGVVLGVLLFGSRRRRHRKELAMKAAQAAAELAKRTAAAISEANTRHHAAPSPPAGPTRRWVTVMFTDLANSTRLNELLGDDEWTRVLGHHREFVRAKLDAFDGEVVGTQGDGFLARFPAPARAVDCAVGIQRELHTVAHEAEVPLEVRIGIHAGDAVEDDGDLVGRVVNVASRVTGQAAPGEILVTEPVADNVDGDVRFDDRGLVDLRGVARARHLLAVEWRVADGARRE
jgi:class 3 adenylate cyclase